MSTNFKFPIRASRHIGTFVKALVTPKRHPIYDDQEFPIFKSPYGDQGDDAKAIAAGYAYADWKESCGQ